MTTPVSTCETCDTVNMRFAWTDTHGIAQCTQCGTPYKLFHYDENHRRLEKLPESIVADEYKPVLREYWAQSHRRIPSGCSFPGGQELASQEDEQCFYKWMRERKPQ